MSQIPSDNQPSDRRLRFNGWSKLFLLFSGVLALSLLIFITTNQKRHDEIRNAEYELCTKAQTIADNQERVITALIDLEESEREHPKEHMATLKVALKLVPDFNCQQFKEGG